MMTITNNSAKLGEIASVRLFGKVAKGEIVGVWGENNEGVSIRFPGEVEGETGFEQDFYKSEILFITEDLKLA